MGLEHGLNIPFERRKYQIGLQAINIKSYNRKEASQIMHVCVEPKPLESATWIGNSKVLYSVKSIIFDDIRRKSAKIDPNEKQKSSKVALNAEFVNVAFYEIDLSYTVNYFAVYLMNDEGDRVNAEGYCIFHLRAI